MGITPVATRQQGSPQTAPPAVVDDQHQRQAQPEGYAAQQAARAPAPTQEAINESLGLLNVLGLRLTAAFLGQRDGLGNACDELDGEHVNSPPALTATQSALTTAGKLALKQGCKAIFGPAGAAVGALLQFMVTQVAEAIDSNTVEAPRAVPALEAFRRVQQQSLLVLMGQQTTIQAAIMMEAQQRDLRPELRAMIAQIERQSGKASNRQYLSTVLEWTRLNSRGVSGMQVIFSAASAQDVLHPTGHALIGGTDDAGDGLVNCPGTIESFVDRVGVTAQVRIGPARFSLDSRNPSRINDPTGAPMHHLARYMGHHGLMDMAAAEVAPNTAANILFNAVIRPCSLSDLATSSGA